MSASRFQAVLFDFFGTLVDSLSASAHNAAVCRMGCALGAPEQAFLEHWLRDYDARGSGRWRTLEDCIVHTCEALGVAPDPQRVSEAAGIRRSFIREGLVLRPDARETIETIKARGLRTGLITDCPPELPELWPALGLNRLIDVRIFSTEARMRKPDPRIYRGACQRLDVPPEACLFVGDGGSRELSGAQAVGMTAVCIKSAREETFDPHRIDPEIWDGPTIGALREVLDFPGVSP